MIDHYVQLLRDTYRIEHYRQAIREVVRPGDTVVEVGSGLGTFSFFAGEAGAGKVHAIESGAIRSLLPHLVADNGHRERIQVIGKPARQAQLDRPADVLVTEDFSSLFLDSDLDQLLLWPRRSLLKEGGRIIPSRVRVYFAPVDCRQELARRDPWQDPAFGYGLRLERVREMALHLPSSGSLAHDQLLADPQLHTELDASTFEAASFRQKFVFRVSRAGSLTALAGWFESDLSPAVTLTNAPGSRSTVWQQGLLFLPPTEVKEGDILEAAISLLRDPWLNHFWEWKGFLQTRDGETPFERSSFRALYLSKDSLRALSRDHCPAETPLLRADRFTLEQLGTGLSFGEIVKQVCLRFPRVFPSAREASLHVRELLERYQ